MTSAGYCAAIVVVLLIAGFRYAGWSPVILIAVLVLLWFGLSAVISFASDRRYVRAFDHTLTHRKSNGPSGSLGIGRAIFIGELVVNLPAIGLLVGLIVSVGSFLQYLVGYEGTGHAPVLPSIVAVVVAFLASWMWWAVAAPRWLLWAMKRVVDPPCTSECGGRFNHLAEQQIGPRFQQCSMAHCRDEKRRARTCSGICRPHPSRRCDRGHAIT